jgi:hypothetical protein
MTYEEIKTRLAKCEFTLKSIKDGSYKNLSAQDLEEKTAKLNILKESYKKMLSEEGRVRTSNSDKAEKLVDKGIDVDLVEPEDLKNELEGDTESSAISDLGQNETAKVAKVTGKAVVNVQNEMGLGVKSAKAVNITPDSFSIEIIFSTGSEEEYKFRIEDGYLFLDNFEYGGGVFDKKLAPVGIKADGKPLLHQDVINRELKSVLNNIMGNPANRGDRFKNETMSDKEFQDAKEAERLEKHPERDKIKKIQAMIAKERRKKNIKEGEYAADKYNVNVYGYQTKYYKICPGAKSFIQDVVDGNYGELNKEEVIRLAKLHDVLFKMEIRALKDSSYATKILDDAQYVSATIKDQVSSMGLPVDRVDYLDGHIEKIKDASLGIDEFLGFGKKKPKLYKHKSTTLFMRYVFMDRIEQEFETYSPRQQAGINNILQAIDGFFSRSDLSKLRDNIGFTIYPTGKKGALKEDNTEVFITIDNPSGLNRTARPKVALKYVTEFTEFLMKKPGLDVSKGTGKRGAGTTAFDIFIPVKFEEVDVNEALDQIGKIQKLISIKKNNETKGAPSGHYFTASGNLVKGRLTKAAREKGARLSDPKDKQRSKVPPVTQYNEEEIDSPEYYFEYLNKLRDSGVTNMFGAVPYLRAEFGLDRNTARQILATWMKSSMKEASAELSKAEKKKLKDMSKSLKKSSKGHAGQAKYLDKLVKEGDLVYLDDGDIDFIKSFVARLGYDKDPVTGEEFSKLKQILKAVVRSSEEDTLTLQEGDLYYIGKEEKIKLLSILKMLQSGEVGQDVGMIKKAAELLKDMLRGFGDDRNEAIEDKELPKGKHSVSTLQKVHELIVDKMKELNDLRKEKGGDHMYQGGSEPGKHSVMDHLKALTKKKKQVEAALEKAVANVGRGQELDPNVQENVDQDEALDRLRDIVGRVEELGEEARDIVRQNFPNELSRMDGYGVFNMVYSSNRYDTTLGSEVDRLEDYGYDDLDDDDYPMEGKELKEGTDMYEGDKFSMKRFAGPNGIALQITAPKLKGGGYQYIQIDGDTVKEFARAAVHVAQEFHDIDRQFPVNEDTDIGHQDDEPGMLKSTAYEAATFAAKLYKKLAKYDQFDGEVDFPNWWQSKLILSKDYLSKAFHYLDSEEKQPIIDKLALEGKNEKKGS